MSDFFAEAEVLIRPNTAGFRAELQTELLAATRGLTVPVTVVPSTAGAGLAGVRAEATNTATALSSVTAAEVAGTKAAKDAAAASAAHARTLGNLEKAAVANTAGLLGLRGAVLTAGTAFIGATVGIQAFIKSIQEFASFERTLNVFQATVGATAEEMERVRDVSVGLGADLTLPGVSAADAATAMQELARAGLSVEEAMAGARGVLQLSTAASISQAEAAELAANALNAFGLAGDQATRVADVLANAANSAQGSISDFGLAFRQSASVARLTGLSLEETATQLTILAQAGLRGSDAGTSLRVSLLRLVNPTKEAAAVIKELGINLRDAQGNIRPDVFVQFGEATAGMSAATRDAAFATVFGADGIRTVSIAARAGRDDLIRLTSEMNEQGSAARLAGAQTEGFSGELEAMQNQMSTLGVSIGSVSTLLVGPLVTSLAKSAEFANKLLGPVSDLAVKLRDLSAAGRGDVDNTTKSTAELLETVNRFSASLANEANPNFRELLENMGPDFRQVLQQSIRSLKAQQAELRALGQDGSALNPIIADLRRQLDALGTTEIRVGVDLSPLDVMIVRLKEIREARAAVGADTTGLDRFIAELEHSAAVAQQTDGNMNRLRDDIEGLGRTGSSAATGIRTLIEELRSLGRESTIVQDQLLKLQSEGGTPVQQIAVLQDDIAVQREIIATAKRQGGPGAATAIREARRRIIADQGQIESLQAEITSDQRRAADAAEQAATDAQEQRDRQFKAIAEQFSGRQDDIRNAIVRAGIEGNVARQIRLNQALIASLQKERRVLGQRLKALKVSADVRRQILEQIDKAIKDAQNDNLRFQEQQKENLQRALHTRLDLRIELAEIKGDVRAQLAAHRRKLAQLRKELKALQREHRGNTVEALELKVEIAREQKAIEELRGQQKDRNNAFKELAFEFLTTQQGFAANLFGNLIPTSMTGGLVSPGGEAQQASRVNQAAALAQTQGGFSKSEVATELDLLRLMLAELKAIRTGRAFPEATFQRHQTAGAMETQ